VGMRAALFLILCGRPRDPGRTRDGLGRSLGGGCRSEMTAYGKAYAHAWFRGRVAIYLDREIRACDGIGIYSGTNEVIDELLGWFVRDDRKNIDSEAADSISDHCE
jgi:hypothetical protein